MTTQSFETAFPRLRAVSPFMPLSPTLAWASGFSWSDDQLVWSFCRILLERQELAASQNVEWLSEIADAAILDLNDRLATLDEERDRRDYRTILFLRMLVTVIPMQATLALGQRGACFDWALRGMGTDYDAGRRFNQCYAYLPFWEPGDARVGLLWMEKLPDWCLPYFLNARDLGSPSDEEVGKFADPCFGICHDLFNQVSQEHPSALESTSAAMASIASWGVSREWSKSDDWVRQLADVWNDTKLPARARPTVASVFITSANDVTGQSIRAWGEEILRDYGHELREHQRLMFLTATVDSREQWLKLREEILAEIRSLVQAANEVQVYGADRIAARESRIDLIKPLLRTLITEEDLAAVMDVLTAWYTEPGRRRCDDNVLLINLAYDDGVAIVWPGGAWINARTSATGHDVVSSALQEALGIETDPSRGPSIDEQREGIPDYSKGRHLEEAMRGYYRLEEVAAGFKTIARPRSLIVFPSLGDPVQAWVGRELGLVLPLEVSLAQPRPYRQIRNVSIWAGTTYYTQFEIDALTEFGALNGWTAGVFDAGAGKAADFRRFYEQPEPDVLWVAGHGEFVAHRPHETGLLLDTEDGGRLLPMEEIASFAVPDQERRLLVLNTCSGATTQGMAGMARIGIAHNIVQPAQAVIGHLWPASQGVSLAFAMLFASHLRGNALEEAFEKTAVEMRTPRTIPGLLRDRLGSSPEGLFRIERDVDDLASILAWGSPVFLS